MPRKKKQVQIPNESDDIVQRIAECQTVVGHINECPAWRVIVKDLSRERQFIDDNWQEITDEKKLQRARELKFAYMHLLNLKNKYEEDLKAAQKELNTLMNSHKEIARDYDSETNLEG